MFELKRLSRDAIPAALEKALRYRMLNEPEQAESICLDVLAAEPDHRDALAMLILALTDQFPTTPSATQRARELLPRLPGEYERAYYAGIVAERQGLARFRTGAPGAGHAAHDWLREAMDWYARAESLRPPGNDDALLRWNSCARLIEANPDIRPAEAEEFQPALED